MKRYEDTNPHPYGKPDHRPINSFSLSKETTISLALAAVIGTGIWTIAFQFGKNEAMTKDIMDFKSEFKSELKEIKTSLKMQEINIIQLCANIRGCSLKK